jgi:prepilin-type N-terminal cleavage/methylation domain-containing protein
MPISRAGNSRWGRRFRLPAASRHDERGVTLIEMVIVVAIVGLIAGITYPAVSTGLESVHLASAADTVASFLNAALNRVERRQEVVELMISLKDNVMVVHSTEPGFERRAELPDGITITAVLPPLSSLAPNAPRQFILMPGGTAPRLGIEITNRKGTRRIVRVDPMTGVPKIEIPAEAK